MLLALVRPAVALLVLARLGGVPSVAALALAGVIALGPGAYVSAELRIELIMGAMLGLVAAVPLLATRAVGATLQHLFAAERAAEGGLAGLWQWAGLLAFLECGGLEATMLYICRSQASLDIGAMPQALGWLAAIIASTWPLLMPMLAACLVIELGRAVAARLAARATLLAGLAPLVTAVVALLMLSQVAHYVRTLVLAA